MIVLEGYISVEDMAASSPLIKLCFVHRLNYCECHDSQGVFNSNDGASLGR